MTNPIFVFATPVFAPPDANGPAGFTTQWHGHGAGHQANNDPGDTAADRHNFDAAVAGRSDQNPTQGSAQDGISEETGLPLVAMEAAAFGGEAEEEDGSDDMLEGMF
ncbi:hypothetical protein [Ovoidimarina sediminis]|uniref:hypothetical protein n=1 Tax=Ovoidimarina sediminis TaxID=3079856 RepID=UPI00290F937E|nr:hypothetical protein [Rhodophyticola sp. MJ-SS7]MDU8942720.1 hypothetical protein [Rhodophyticola sp. MJ-SS7]